MNNSFTKTRIILFRFFRAFLFAACVAGQPAFQAEAHTVAGSDRVTREAAFFAGATRIMPIGNSITQAYAGRNSYRRPLWHRLKNAGYSVDFVGSQSSNHNGGPANPDFDQNHEGHWGWRADQLLGGIGGWANTYRPDVVLMHVGSNDMFQGQSVSSTISELSQMIDRIRAANPYVKILLAKLIPPTEWNGRLSRINALNNAIPGLVAQKNTSRSPVILVDQTAGFYAHSDTYDGVHPNSSGESKMAARWYDALTRILIKGTITAPAPTPIAGFSGHYQLVAKHSNKAIDVAWASGSNGAKVQQWSYQGKANQQWSLQSTGDGYYKIVARHSGKVLTVSSTSAATQQYDYQGRDSQKWKVESVGSGYYKIYNKADRRALDVYKAYTYDGAIVQVWSYYGGSNQLWRIQSVSTSGRIASDEDAPEEMEAPADITIFPNPAAGRTMVAFASEEEQEVTIQVVNAKGQEVAVVSQLAAQGENEVELSLAGLPRGLYTLRLLKGNGAVTKKLVVTE